MPIEINIILLIFVYIWYPFDPYVFTKIASAPLVELLLEPKLKKDAKQSCTNPKH